MNILMTSIKHISGLLLVLFILSCRYSRATDRRATYGIEVMGMHIGQYTVNQQTRGNEIRIEAITDVEVNLIFTYRVKYVQNSLYRDGQLWRSHVQTIKNGKVNSDVWLDKQGDRYCLKKDGQSTSIHDSITYSGSLLYFNEPKGVSFLYKERSGEKQALKQVSDHIYILTDGKNKKTNEYEYQEGMLVRAALVHPLATIRLELSR
ncbi:MAG: hypothetical protein PHI28_06040 [Mangrovibacterium sp.]|nr:hypothetical protein [Mangrovibacterium sp.]